MERAGGDRHKHVMKKSQRKGTVLKKSEQHSIQGTTGIEMLTAPDDAKH